MQELCEECAQDILEVVPMIMQLIRVEMRSQRTPDLTVPQFRMLTFINRNAGASLSEVAEHIGITLPSASKLADGLVGRALITRREATIDRRRIILEITPEGSALLNAALQGAQASLARRLQVLAPEELVVVLHAMQVLHPIYFPEAIPTPAGR